MVTMNGKYTISGVIVLTGESPTRYAASTVCGATPSRMKSGTKIGAKIAHFGTEPGMMKSSSTMTRINTIKQRQRADVGLLQHSASATAMTRGMLL